MNILEEYNNEIIGIDRDKISLEIYRKYLLKILEKLNSNEFKSDPRFVTYGRRDFLKEELENKLQSSNYIDAFYDIYEYIEGERCFINRFKIPSSLNIELIEKNAMDYLKDGIICEEEKNIISEMINKFLNTINDK